ncbi:MAG: sulfurtransferase [Sulfuriflexus sp.]|nr:sulfurtransferase [Sulfuriflexus sp.]
MSNLLFQTIVECDELADHLSDKQLVIIDVCKKEVWQQAHIPGAVHIEYPQILHVEKPIMGLLPDAAEFEKLMQSLGINNDTHIVAYDDEGGGKASRLLWTLEAYGHTSYSLLNGGFMAWANEGWPIDKEITKPGTGNFSASKQLTSVVSSRKAVLENLDNTQVQLLDARSIGEYTGEKKFAARGGHIPGAIHYDWMAIMDPSRNGRLKNNKELTEALAQRGFSTDKHITCYCHTHHRSALSFIMLKSLGYTDISGYPGSWSDWGNDNDTPIE